MIRWQSLGLRTQMLTFYLLASIIIVGVMGVALFYSTSAIITQEAENTTAMAIENSGHRLEMYIDQLKGLSGLLAQNPQVCRYFGQPHSDGGIVDTDRADIEALVASILHENPEIVSIILIGADGRLITNEAHLDMKFTGNIQDQEWYRTILSNTMPVLTSAHMQEFSMNRDNWVISLGRELKNDMGQHIGVLRIDLKYDAIEYILQSLSLGRNGYTFIINDREKVVYHPNSVYFTQEEKREDLLNIVKLPESELSGKQMLTYSYSLSKANWLLVGVASLDGVARMQWDIIVVLWVLSLIMLMVAMGSSSLFAHSVSHPVKELEKAMSLVEQGFLDTKVYAAGSAELVSLSRHFRSMMDRIRNLMKEIREKEQSLRASELKTLHSQINPHFLYNTLDTIVWLAEFGDMQRVVAVSKAMARFFRLSLRGGSEMTTVRDELDHVRQYLYIQKERYQDKLTYEISADESLLDISIPKILLQPLVENAIYHGIRKLPGTGFIRITAKAQDDALLLSVEDNGVGFEASVPVQRDKDSQMGGLGLQNVDDRINLYYGEGYGVKVQSTPGEGAKVTLRLPGGKIIK